MVTSWDLTRDYPLQYLACHDLVAIDYINLLPRSGTPPIDLAKLRAMNPNLVVLVYVNLVSLWESAARAGVNPVYKRFWDTIDPFRMRTVGDELLRTWPVPPDPTSPLSMTLMNVTSNYTVSGRTYLAVAADYLVNDVLPAAGGIGNVDGFFLDNAYASTSGLSWIEGYLGSQPIDSNRDGLGDSAAFLDSGYATAVRSFYAELERRIPGVILVGNHPGAADLDFLEGRYGEGDGGASSLNSTTGAMSNVIVAFSDRNGLAAVPHSIVNLANSRFTPLDAAAYAYLLGGFAKVSYDDGSSHNQLTPIPVEYAEHGLLGAPVDTTVGEFRGVFYRDYTTGKAIVNGGTDVATVTFASGQSHVLARGAGKIVYDLTPIVAVVRPSCQFSLGVVGATSILRVETDAVCGVWACADGWWSSTSAGYVPQTIETAPGGSYRFNLQTELGWASDGAGAYGTPTLSGMQLTNTEPNGVGGTNFRFYVSPACVLTNEP